MPIQLTLTSIRSNHRTRVLARWGSDGIVYDAVTDSKEQAGGNLSHETIIRVSDWVSSRFPPGTDIHTRLLGDEIPGWFGNGNQEVTLGTQLEQVQGNVRKSHVKVPNDIYGGQTYPLVLHRGVRATRYGNNGLMRRDAIFGWSYLWRGTSTGGFIKLAERTSPGTDIDEVERRNLGVQAGNHLGLIRTAWDLGIGGTNFPFKLETIPATSFEIYEHPEWAGEDGTAQYMLMGIDNKMLKYMHQGFMQTVKHIRHVNTPSHIRKLARRPQSY